MEKETIPREAARAKTDELYEKHHRLIVHFTNQMYGAAKREEYESKCWNRILSLAQMRRFEKLSDKREEGFLLGIFRRVYYEQLRRYRREAKAVTQWDLEKQAAEKDNSPRELAANRELVGAIVAFVNTMSALDRIIFHYSVVEGRKSTWVGRKMKMSSDAVRVRLHRIRRRIVDRFPNCF